MKWDKGSGGDELMRVLLRTLVVAIGWLIAVGAGPVAAQTPSVEEPRFRISMNAGAELSTHAFDSTTTPMVYLENASIHTPYTVGDGLLFDGGVQYRIAGGFGVGVAVSWFSKANDATVDASLPHPFFFHTPRTITGTAGGLRREELVTHLQAVYVIRPAARIDVALTAGPSFFRVKQALVFNVSFTDTYPYDAPMFTAAQSQQATSTRTTFNAGADVGLKLTRRLGVGALVRYSKAAMMFVVPTTTATVTADAGGVQAAAGIRLYF
jgi:hypothetical protein